ncbi:MAG: Nucleosomal histone H3-Lys79 methylase [Thelocarpon superellum]|nr:MAG: Nucleosomal histone H3-Lys79 methylase [Thelocarpon superellum]
MGFFDQFHKKGAPPALKPQQATVRKELVRTTVRPGLSTQKNKLPLPLPPKGGGAASDRKPFHAAYAARSRSNTPSTAPSRAPSSTLSPEPGKQRTAPARKRRLAEAQRVVSSDSDDDDESGPDLSSNKRLKSSGDSAQVDVKRRLRSREAFDEPGATLSFVHAADIASLKQPGKFTPAFDTATDSAAAEVYLQYPSAAPRERFELAKPRDQQDVRPLQDILQVTEDVARFYLTEEQGVRVLDESTGIHRKLKRAIAHGSEKDFRDGLDEYNDYIVALRDDGALARNLDETHTLLLPLVEHILTQTYARTVSLKVDSLRKYENGTDNVYGELLPRFIAKIIQDTKLRSYHVFVDLGSGVANVVLQTALQVGCESWGCEMMENACELAELQEREFAARCRLWGLARGQVHLERGDFLKNTRIAQVLKRADVVLVNNQAFTPALNQGLVNLFLDLKEGCQIVSLKSFVPSDHKITTRNINSPVNLLEVQTKPYYSNCVSWTNAPGTYCIARKDVRRLKAFARVMK